MLTPTYGQSVNLLIQSYFYFLDFWSPYSASSDGVPDIVNERTIEATHGVDFLWKGLSSYIAFLFVCLFKFEQLISQELRWVAVFVRFSLTQTPLFLLGMVLLGY